MTTRPLKIGDIVTARFPEQQPQGREQEGYRPAIVVGFPHLLGTPRFPVIIVVPMTTYRSQSWADNSPDLYPVFPAGIASLKSPSIALLDQIRAIDARRIVNYRGSLTTEQYQIIEDGLKKFFKF
jgi:mRNA interferase MazF